MPPVTAPDPPKASSWLSHPLVVSVLTPVVLAVVFGAGSVWMTQASILWRVGQVETSTAADKAEAERRIDELKSQMVPRGEHIQRWDAVEGQLRDIKEQGARTNERVDKIYDLLVESPR
jgi:hypothetical protein